MNNLKWALKGNIRLPKSSRCIPVTISLATNYHQFEIRLFLIYSGGFFHHLEIIFLIPDRCNHIFPLCVIRYTTARVLKGALIPS